MKQTNNERKIKVSLTVFISAVVLAIVFDLLTISGAFSPIIVDGKATGLGNPAFVMDIIAIISVTYFGLCLLFKDFSQKAVSFTALISVVMIFSMSGEYVSIHLHHPIYLPILLVLYFLVSISPFIGLFIYKVATK